MDVTGSVNEQTLFTLSVSLDVCAETYYSLASHHREQQSNRCMWRSIAVLVSSYQTWWPCTLKSKQQHSLWHRASVLSHRRDRQWAATGVTYLSAQCRAEGRWDRWTQKRRWLNLFASHLFQDPLQTTHPASFLYAHTHTHTHRKIYLAIRCVKDSYSMSQFLSSVYLTCR